MLKMTAALAALILSSAAIAQSEPAAAAESASAPASAPAPAPLEPVMGFVKEKVSGGERPSDFCDADRSGTVSIPEGSAVLVVRKWPCKSRYGASFNKDMLQVLHAGKKVVVPVAAVFLSAAEAKRLDELSLEQADANLEGWTLTSLRMRKLELETALKEVANTARHGLALVYSNVYDVSEHTEGTGFKVTVHNSTKKVIKYVTFTVVGLNAVGDPVKDRLKGTTQTLRGIGPIAPDETSSYSKDYMWMTDIVDSHKLVSIKVEYMDGSSKAITDMKPVRLSQKTRSMLLDDE